MYSRLSKPVILVSSCASDIRKGYNQAIRETWGKVSLIPIFFFIGYTDDALATDEIMVEAPDNYYSLPMKTALSVRWALNLGYTHFFRAFTDTYVDTGRLLRSGFENHEYVGNMCGFHVAGFMHGGPGYWLGPQAGQIVANELPVHEKFEDQWVGKMMRRHNIGFVPDFRYSMGTSYDRRELPSLPTNDIISEHLSNSAIYEHKNVPLYDPSMMHGRHSNRFPKLDKNQLF